MKVGKKGWASERTMEVIRRAIDFVIAESGVSQAKLAKFCGVSQGTISCAHRGRILSATYAGRIMERLMWLITEACKENGITPSIREESKNDDDDNRR